MQEVRRRLQIFIRLLAVSSGSPRDTFIRMLKKLGAKRSLWGDDKDKTLELLKW
jgi:hypothetical protein